MRIALFSDTYPPQVNGVSTSVFMLHKHLAVMGHEVLVVAPSFPDVTESEDNIIRIPSVPFKTQRLATVAGPLVYMNITKFAPDIIHTHSEFTVGILGRFMAFTLRKPHVHTMHTVWELYTRHIIDSSALEPTMIEAARKYTALICNQADRVIAPTKKTEDLLNSYKVHREISVIPTGIDIDRFAPEFSPSSKLQEIRAGLGIKESDKVLVNICRLEKEKNLDKLISSISGYLLLHKDVKFVIVGDGTAKKELQQLAADMGLGEQVIFAGQHPWEEINLYYRIGDVFIAASESETQGLTYIEAMASGLPVVAKEDRCLDDLLIEGENGFMFNSDDELVEAVDKLLYDNEMRHRFSEKAMARAHESSSEVYVSSVLELYKELLKEPPQLDRPFP